MQSGTIFDYALWRGDITFEEAGFNDVDNLVFSFLAYADFQNVKVSKEENENGLTIKEYYDRLMASGGFPKELDLLIHDDEFSIFANSKRFGSVLIKNYIDIIKYGEDDAIQFSAMDFCFGENEHYIGFRGTDDSIAGWKEDLAMTYRKVPGQDLAVDYLNSHVKEGGIYYVGGHSKGGNLAIYGAAKMDKALSSLVKRVYTNDAPGICNEVMDPVFLKKIDHKTVRIIPTYCVIGMTFPFPFSDCRIIHSNEKGLVQHNLKSWQVRGNELYLADQIDPEASALDEALAQYVIDTKLEDRGKILDEVFDAFDDSGKKKTVSSVRNGGLKELQRFLMKLADKNPETRKTVTRLPLTMIFGKTLMSLRHVRPIDFLLHNMALPIGVLSIILGFVFLFLPFHNFPLFIGSIFLVVTIFELVTLFYYLFLTKWNIKRNMLRIYLCTVLVALSASFFFSGEVMGGFSCIIFGIVMMVLAFTVLGRIIDMYYKDNIFSFVVALIEMIGMFTVGVYFIVINDYTSEVFATILGVICLVMGTLKIFDGVGDIIRSAYQRRNQ